MSHTTQMQTTFTDQKALTVALRALGYQVAENGQARVWAGRTTPADIVVTSRDFQRYGAYDVGFVRAAPDAPFTADADWSMVGADVQRQFLAAVGNEYFLQVNEAKARSLGMRVLGRTKLANGATRLRVEAVASR